MEEVLGDLEEKFYATLAKRSPFRARLNYWYQVLNYLRPFAIRKRSKSYSNFTPMLSHNLTVTFRNFKKFKTQFLINLAGLSTGLACVLLIFLWVSDEKQIDKFHKNDDQLYQVMSNHTDASGIFTWRGVPGLLLEEIQSTVPEVKKAVATTDAHEYTLSVDESYIKANGKFASTDFFDVFSYPLAQGDPESALSDKSGIVISESLALRFFKTTDAIGRNMDWHFWGQRKTVQVTGILKNVPKNSSEQFDFIMSWNYYHDDLIEYKQWGNYYARIMVVLNSNSEMEIADARIDAIFKENLQGENVTLFLTSYSDRYLFSKYENGMQAGGRIEYVRLFSIIAIFILFIACINFINLSTARASHRTKEIGIKKSLGASRKSLVGQYFTESILLSIISLFVAFILVWLLLPPFNYIAQKELSLVPDPRLVYASLGLILAVGILAGSYPALYLSGFDPIEILKGKFSRKTGEVWARKILVVLQFTLSIILTVAVVVVYHQMEFVKNKNLGYDRDNLIYFEREGKLIENSEAFVNELKTKPGIEDAAVSGFMVGGVNSTGGVDWEGKTPEDQVQFWEIRSGYGSIDLLGIELVQGRLFSKEFGSDSANVIFNETAIAAMGMEDPIGKTIRHYQGNRKIIGVVKDFNLISLHTRVEPMIFLFNPEETHFIMARLKPGDEGTTISEIESLYESFNPGYVFKPQFLDQDYQALYASEERVASLSKYFAGFAILISCLGLFGLAAYTTEKRIKEIGIRKVLGSGTWQVVYLLSSDFTKMVLIAIVLALPTGYYIGNMWLENFAYRIDLEWWFFAGAGILALVIAWITVSMQTLKAARVNPSDCLRDE